jgi:hypothetical protein
MTSRLKRLSKARWAQIFVLLFVGLFWRSILAEAAILSDTLRGSLLSIEGATRLKTEMVWRARRVPSEIGYAMREECYVSLLRDYENGCPAPPTKNAAAAFRNAFGCYVNMNVGSTSQYAEEKARYARAFTRAFGRPPADE